MQKPRSAIVIGALLTLSTVGCGGGAGEPPAPVAANRSSDAGKQIAPKQSGPVVPPGAEPLSDDELVAMGMKRTPPAKTAVAKTPPRPALAPGAEPILESEVRPASQPLPAKPSNLVGLPPGAEPDLDHGPAAAATTSTQPEFPADLSQWTAAQFRLARQKNQPRLVQAVRELGRGNSTNPDAASNARLLGELLQPSSLTSTVAAAPGAEGIDLPATAGASSSLAPAIVEALGLNGSTEARAILKQILLGNQSSDLSDRVLTTHVLRTLVAHPDEQNQRILAAVLTVPDSIRPPGRGQMTADDLQQECLRQVRPIATAEFRLQLAERANQHRSSAASRQRLLAMLTTPEAVNLNAQIELLVGGQINESKLAAIDRQVGQISQEVLDRLLSATPAEFATSQAAPQVLPAIGSSEDPVPVTHEQSFPDFIQLAHQLWRADFVKAAAARLEASENLNADIALANLAATLPCDSIRTAFARRWEQQWASEASTVENSRLFLAGARDPGLMVVLKELPRATPAAKAQAVAKAGAKIGDTTQSQRTEKEQSARLAWLRTSEVFARVLADHLATVADVQSHRLGQAGAATAKPIGSIDEFDKLLNSTSLANAQNQSAVASPSDADLPAEMGISLHLGARVKSSCRIDWPADFGRQFAPTTTAAQSVRFVRLTSESPIDNSYGRQLKTAIVRTTDTGRWVDALVKLDGGRARSIEVLINRVDKGSPAVHGAAEKLMVDLISVEIADPLGTPATSVANVVAGGQANEPGQRKN
jgi:hypothetical protein